MQIHQSSLAWFCGVLELHPAGLFTLDSRVELMYIRTLFPSTFIYFVPRASSDIPVEWLVRLHILVLVLHTLVWWAHGSWLWSLNTKYQTVLISCHNMEYSVSAYSVRPTHPCSSLMAGAILNCKSQSMMGSPNYRDRIDPIFGGIWPLLKYS